ncbi:hypothetical protein [Falsiroseomonas oryziterrae]|uniref:hypothetical protein n=1 Tax=Falsiroseomonas oryziterrae TaxID=2911368 RepID=UPI001F2AF44A|nr:hypothetical protein [Roseomonas sp. NPKOSM-4]
MPTRVCTEPSIEGGTCRIKATQQDILVFAHVDRCMTITVVLEDGLLGGHVSMCDEDTSELNPTLSITNFATKMKAMISGKIIKVIFVGANTPKDQAGGAAHYTLRRALEALGADTNKAGGGYLFVDTCDTEQAFDLFFDLGTQKMTIQRWRDDRSRDATAAPPIRQDDILLQDSYVTLAGKYDLGADGSRTRRAVRATG